MALKTKRKTVESGQRGQKLKFQADLVPADDRMIRVLKQELAVTSNTDFLADALALFRWAVSERKQGHRIVSETPSGERKELLFPRLERVAPDLALPRVDLEWTDRELENLAKLMSASEAPAPTPLLIRAMRD